MKIKSIIIFIAMAITFFSCQKKERDLQYIQQEMIELGYEGTFREPSTSLERAAISLVGIDEMLIYEEIDNHIVILQFKSTNEEEIRNRIESVITFLEPYLSPEDINNITNAKELLDNNTIIHNNIMLAWQSERPENLIYLVERNF